MIDLEALFSQPTVIETVFRDRTLRHHLLEPNQTQYFEYQRQLRKLVLSNGRTELTSESLLVDCWYYDQLCQKVEAKDGDGFVEVPDFKTKISPPIKRLVINEFEKRLNIEE